MRFPRVSFARFAISVIILVMTQFVLSFLGGFGDTVASSVYWVCVGCASLVMARMFSLDIVLLATLFAPLAGIAQGMAPDVIVAAFLAMGNAIYVLLIFINERRSPLWGVIIGSLIKSLYLWMVFNKVIPAFRQPPDEYFIIGVSGWKAFVGSLAGGLLATPYLFKRYLDERGLGENERNYL